MSLEEITSCEARIAGETLEWLDVGMGQDVPLETVITGE